MVKDASMKDEHPRWRMDVQDPLKATFLLFLLRDIYISSQRAYQASVFKKIEHC